MTKNEMTLDELKKEYKKFEEKYKLPSFSQLNEDFHIEKVLENETDYLLREIRRYIAEKFFNYLRFTETLLNPANAQSMFVFSVVKLIDSEKKKILSEIYNKLSKNEIKMMIIDMNYSERNEAEYIKESYKIWNEIKKDLLEIVKDVEKNWDNKFEGKSKGYFG